MDKLKPLLNNPFWMLFGATIIVPLVGWWMTAGWIEGQVDTKLGEIKTAEGKVPAPSDLTPNQGFVEAAQKIVDVKKQAVRDEVVRLWDLQQSRMTWPQGMQSDMAEFDYGDEITDRERIRYRVEYPREVDRVIRILKPYEPKDYPNGLVAITGELPFAVVKQKLASATLKSQEMWEAQEDIWLAEAIFRAIAEVNRSENPDLIKDAPIFEIKQLQLRGGQVTPLGQATSSDSSPMDGGGGDPTDPAADLFGAADGASGSTGGTGDGTGVAGVNVDPIIVFGDDALATAGDGDMTETTSFLGSRTMSQEPQVRRYIEDEEGKPYRTRGFYLHVTMRNEFVPDLMLALTNMDWPTYIAHTRVAELNPDPVEYVGERNDFASRGGGGFDDGGGSGGPRIGILPQRTQTVTPRTFEGGGMSRTGERGSEVDLLPSVLGHPANAEVVICGIMTIYREPSLEGLEAPAPESTDVPPDGETPTTDDPMATGDDPMAVDDPMATDADPMAEPGIDPEGMETTPDPADPEAGTDTMDDAVDGESSDPAEAPEAGDETDDAESAGTTEPAPASNTTNEN